MKHTALPGAGTVTAVTDKTGLMPAGINDRAVGRVQRALGYLKEAGLSGLIQLIRKHGLRQSYKFIARNIRFAIAVRADRRFDRAHGVDTGGSIRLESLNISSQNRALGNEYVSTSAKSFGWMMKALPDDMVGYTFIDIGAGKGRTLLLATRFPFARIIGVEFAHELVAIARKNIERFYNPDSKEQAISMVDCDAAQFEFPHEPLVVYFYNPFSPTLFAKVVARLIESLQAQPRDCFLVYATTIEGTIDAVRAIIAETGAFKEHATTPMPLFWDAVRSIRYAVFQIRGNDPKY